MKKRKKIYYLIKYYYHVILIKIFFIKEMRQYTLNMVKMFYLDNIYFKNKNDRNIFGRAK